MDITESLQEIRAISQGIGHPVLEQKLAALQEHIGQLLHENNRTVAISHLVEERLVRRVMKLEHDLAQPLLAIQSLLHLLPEFFKEEKRATDLLGGLGKIKRDETSVGKPNPDSKKTEAANRKAGAPHVRTSV